MRKLRLGWPRFFAGIRKLGAQVADGCLVYLAERENIDAIFTAGPSGLLGLSASSAIKVFNCCPLDFLAVLGRTKRPF